MPPSTDFEFNKLHDSVHKTIGLSKLEVEIIDTRTFQRLRNIKQLSLVHYVFPGADYSRFSHSLGTCHLAGKLFDAMYKNPTEEQLKLKQKIRLAGLLHDIGHYPFSHTTEDAIKQYINKAPNAKSGLVKKGETTTETTFSAQRYLDHENIGSKILDHNKEIRSILDKNGIDPIEISNLFIKKGESPPEIKILISSDLDADRLDYLLRDAHYMGLPYGSTDLNYILRQMRHDKDNRPCFDSKALRTIDHFLLCRYFDYSQVIFQKTVTGMEEVLKRVLQYLITKNEIKYSESEIIELISSGKWNEYDDIHIMGVIRAYYNSTDTPSEEKLFMKSIIERIPPKEIAKLEYIDGIDRVESFKAKISDLTSLTQRISEKFGINGKHIFVWDNGGLRLTKMGRMTEVSKAQAITVEDLNQRIRIHHRISEDSHPIMERNDSLMSILADRALYSMRLFVLDPNLTDAKVMEIQNFVFETLPFRDWK
ncbi:MAG: HD domain-containing protein [Methanoregula sp.]|jgi:hypothetical protein|uniref:HD domain-containing protein n=1 Tax=Methanoregula sp. TaxID=2052170 RepID=UPI003D0CA559